MKIIINSIFPGMVLICSSAIAGETAKPATEVLELRNQLEGLKASYIRQAKIINMLESRLKQLEGGRQPIAAKQSVPKQQTVAKSTVAKAQARQSPQVQAAVKEEKVVKEAPRNSSFTAVLGEEHALFDNRFTFEVGASYSRFNRAQINLSGFLVLDAIFLGSISVDETESDVVTTDLTARYGITDRMQVDFNAPFLYRTTNFFKGNVGGESAGSAEADVDTGPELADINFGVSYQILPESADLPDIVWNVRVKAPTGTDPYGIGTVELENGLIVPESLPSGNGVWAMSSGFSFVKTVDPAVIFANINFFHNFETDFDNIGGNTPTPGSIALGNAYQYGLGMAFALNERLSMNFSFTQRFSDKAKIKAEGGEWASIIGSNANVASLNMGMTFALSKHLTMVTNLGVGLTSDAPDVQLGVKFPYRF
ncbi:MAG: hypothetical protein GQ532_10490 [Methylomarinum sp.]|nr:hypothetical protein [Methylomarinum sp.]